MPDKLYRHFNTMGMAVYAIAMLTVSLLFSDYALKTRWIAWGAGTVVLFFGMTYGCYHRWRHDEAKNFTRKLFLTALAIRTLYVVGIYFYYLKETGLPMEYGAADSRQYHESAIYLSQLAREGYLKAIFQQLEAHTMGFSDQGYILYLTSLYSLFGTNTLGPRLLKALMSAYMCVAIYKLTARNLDERTAKLAAILALFMPHFIHYNGTYMKETELLFLATLALERFDACLRQKKHQAGNIAMCILLTLATFGFRTAVGMILIGSYFVTILFTEKTLLSNKAKTITTIAVIGLLTALMLTPIGKEVIFMFKVNITESNYMVVKYNYQGLKYAEYADYRTMAPGAFVLPLSNMVEVANPNQKMMNGTYYVKNYLAFFAMWCILVAIRERKTRAFRLMGSYTIVYVLMIAFSFAVNSERYHLPALPGILVMAAFAMTRFRRKDFPFYYLYCGLVVLAIVGWNYLKLSGRGLIF